MSAFATTKDFLVVAFGGAIGSTLRFGIETVFTNSNSKFPIPILIVNLVGSLFIGIAVGLFAIKPNSTAQLFLVTGLLGGFTTFSAFSIGNLNLIKSGHTNIAIANIALQVILGLFFAWIGFGIAGKLVN